MMLGALSSLKGLRRNVGLLKSIVWDVEPKQLMEPRCSAPGAGQGQKKNLSGFFFYIERTGGAKPALYIMCHTESGCAETVGKIDEIPGDLLTEAVSENKGKEYFGMCPINKKIEDWLRKELGIPPREDET